MPFDPVCGRKVKKSNLSYEYQGRIYYFCSEECRNKFIEKPSRYILENWNENWC
ncbi:YHS domain-containing protein [Euryarchaeota archaeon ex4484_178]|nr:MAG: YHS domain-containing protein [Euryarchaeota archaeon ex4484_178]